MREIKFRGKRIDTGEWVYGFLALHDFIADGQTHHEIAPETVDQYTGLRDVDGKEIYEGDVITFDQTDAGGSKHVGEITFSLDPCLDYIGLWLWKKNGWCPFDGCGRIEILGNIYESPELLA